MIKVFMEYYWNDTQREKIRKNFPSLAELEDWIFSQMYQDCSSGKCCIWFPTPEKVKEARYRDLHAIEFSPSTHDPYV